MKEPKPQANVTFVTFASVCNKYIAAVNWKNFIAAFLLMVYCGSYALAELQLPAIFSSSVVTVINPNCKIPASEVPQKSAADQRIFAF